MAGRGATSTSRVKAADAVQRRGIFKCNETITLNTCALDIAVIAVAFNPRAGKLAISQDAPGFALCGLDEVLLFRRMLLQDRMEP